MKRKTLLLVATLAWLAFLDAPHSAVFAQGAAFTYQGRLTVDGTAAAGSYDFQFTVYDAQEAGNAQSLTVFRTGVAVSNGLFTVTLDFGAEAFTGGARWLDIGVRPGGSMGAFQTLLPRQPIRATPYAMTASNLTGTLPADRLTGTLPSGLLSGSYSNGVTFDNAGNSFTGDGSGLTELNASQLNAGTVPDARLGATVARTNQVWLLGGNSGTTPLTHFLGTSDNQPLELKVNGKRILRLEPNPGGGDAGNIIGGHISNRIELPTGGSAILGGGFAGGPNVIRPSSSGSFIGGGSANEAGPNANDVAIGGGFGNAARGLYGVIAGGAYNTIQTNALRAAIGGGYSNMVRIGASSSTIAGGFGNEIQSGNGTVGGGQNNVVASSAGTVSGGTANRAGGAGAAVGGGQNNLANGTFSAIPGGTGNEASGDFSFAAGWVAKATHEGSFVWSDFSSGLHFGSTLGNQFSARAHGGVRFETAGAGLTVDGRAVLTGRVNPDDATHSNIVSVVSGSSANVVPESVYGATIGGGGAGVYNGSSYSNSVTADFGTVSGGGANRSSGQFATVGGG
jgi:hypothetical protein